MSVKKLLEDEDVENGNSRRPPQRELSSPAFARSWTDTLAFPRAFTNMSLIDFESEEAWTRRLIEEYAEVAKEGPEGDIPIPEGFGKTRDFWVMFVVSALFGSVVGFVGLVVLNIVEEVPKLWVNNGSFDEVGDCDYYAGSYYWVAVTTGMGFLVGLIRWIFAYPDNLPGFFKEIKDCHVHTKYVPLTVSLSVISLAGGACMGPEMCLGTELLVS